MNYPNIDRPTAIGHYWYRGGASHEWIMIEVFVRFNELWLAPPVPMTVRALSEVPFGGDWRGPIPEPTP